MRVRVCDVCDKGVGDDLVDESLHQDANVAGVGPVVLFLSIYAPKVRRLKADICRKCFLKAFRQMVDDLEGNLVTRREH